MPIPEVPGQRSMPAADCVPLVFPIAREGCIAGLLILGNDHHRPAGFSLGCGRRVLEDFHLSVDSQHVSIFFLEAGASAFATTKDEQMGAVPGGPVSPPSRRRRQVGLSPLYGQADRRFRSDECDCDDELGCAGRTRRRAGGGLVWVRRSHDARPQSGPVASTNGALRLVLGRHKISAAR
jgi:hypothetical protein